MITEKLHFSFSNKVITDTGFNVPDWQPGFWLYASILPIILYGLEALKISAYWTSQAPNVSTNMQLILMFIFYGLWTFVPWLIWQIPVRALNRRALNWRNMILILGGFGIILSGLHMLVLSTIQRIMYFPPDNPSTGIIHLIHTLGEVWLGNIGIWFIAYSLTAAAILFVILPRTHKEPVTARYEVMQNGRTWSVSYTDIFWIKAAGNYAELHTVRGVLMVRKTLSRVAKEIAPGNFLQSHRSAYVNGHHVVSIKPHQETSGFLVQLSNGDEAPLSRRKLSQFRNLLKFVE